MKYLLLVFASIAVLGCHGNSKEQAEKSAPWEVVTGYRHPLTTRRLKVHCGWLYHVSSALAFVPDGTCK